MMQALVLKELRQQTLVLALALGSYLWIVSVLTSIGPLAGLELIIVSRTHGAPFLAFQFELPFVVLTVALALLLGFRQSLSESQTGTYLFLLHRPCSRGLIFTAKLAVGLGAMLGLGALPILLYAWWAATPGQVPAPFEWSMTETAWVLWASLPVMYLGAFLSALRPGRWFGTRLLPLVAAAMVVAGFHYVTWNTALAAFYLAVAYGVFLAAIAHVAAARDYS